jgi:hypothetical protein
MINGGSSKYSDPQLATFSLRGSDVNELRDLARRYLKLDDTTIKTADRVHLISELSDAAASNDALSRDLRKRSISLKPSFYLMRFTESFDMTAAAAQGRLEKYLATNATTLSQLQVQLVQVPKPRHILVLLTWQTSLTYWDPSFALKQIKQLKFGFVDINSRVKKAILCCHTAKEREKIASLIKGGFGLTLSPIVLTKRLLDQIGTFDHVKRAQYVVVEPNQSIPMNITYADKNLAARSLAREEEANPRSIRQQSFYQIPVTNPLIEEGVGATSDSGKLWIPKQTPVESVRDYCSALLRRVTDTLDDMSADDDVEGVLSTFDFETLPDLLGADPLAFRKSVAVLLRELIGMLTRKEKQRVYTIPFWMAKYGVPLFFFRPRLRLGDRKSGEMAYWADERTGSQQVVVSGTEQHPSFKSYPGDALLDLEELYHPITENKIVAEADPLNMLELIPNDRFNVLLAETVRTVSKDIKQIRNVQSVFFRLSNGLITLDVDRAFGEVPSKPVLIRAEEIAELRIPISKHEITPAKRGYLNERLLYLGEKCTQMSDENCRTCVKDQQTLCLRSLLGRYLNDTEILAHKGIELSDLKCRGTVGGKERRMWGFAKMSVSRTDKGFTAVNKSGSVLLSQILGQIDKSTFQTVVVISPAVINQDFADRAEVLCQAFGKELCILGGDQLARILCDFEEQAKFDGIDLKALYKRSKSKKRKVLAKNARTKSGWRGA